MAISLKGFGKKFIVAGFIFLTIQYLSYLCLAFLGRDKPTERELVRLQDNGPIGIEISVNGKFLEEAKMFDQVFRFSKCLPFIISPKVLAHVWNVRQNITDCVGDGYNCMLESDDMFFGLEGDCINRKTLLSSMTNGLNRYGFNISHTKTKKFIGLPGVFKSFTTSLILKRLYGFTVVIFHSREDNFWWHGSIYEDKDAVGNLARAKLLPDNLQLMHREGAIPKFELEEVKLFHYNFMVPKNIPAFLRAISGSAADFIECNYRAAEIYYRHYNRDTSEEAERFRHQAWKLLSRAKRILNDLDVPFWLSSGTCLGYLRQCEFIPYSQDVDLGVFASDYKEEIIPAFMSHGFELHHTFGILNDSYQIAFKYGKIKLDIFFFYLDQEKGTMWNGGTEARSGRKFKYTFPPFSLCWTEFLELLVRVPCNITKYIEANYGPNWQTPVTKWSWKLSPPNSEPNGMWPREQWPQVINIQRF